MAITLSEERGVRFLHFGSSWIQGAMRIARPFALELEYTRDLMYPLLLREADWPRSVLQIGLGSASVTKFLYRNRPQARLTVVEILPEVVTAASQFFRLPEDPARIRIEIGDGHDYVTTKRGKFDLIVVDGFDDKGRPGMLETEAFYLGCRQRLASGGMVSVNLLTRRRGVEASVQRIRAAFGEHVLVIPPSEAGNSVAIAALEPIEARATELRRAAEALKSTTGLDLSSALARLTAGK
jgi:spermidine synthase